MMRDRPKKQSLASEAFAITALIFIAAGFLSLFVLILAQVPEVLWAAGGFLCICIGS